MSAANIPISKTKIILPKRRTELLTRRRLLDSLYEILDRKLIMISAPAGYGKTSLLIDLAHHSDLPFCWLALDPLDRELQRFIAYLIASLTEHFPKFGNRALSMLNTMTSLDDGMERLLVTLVNEIYDEIPEHFALVLDDFHLLDDVQAIRYFVNRFVQLVGENCHLILSSRSLPELSDMTLLVAREQVGGLDFSDLSFRPEEIQALLSQNQQIHLSDDDARKLVEATEGWITGLQFTDFSLVRSDGTGFRPSHGVGVSVFDYLGRQVLEHQPDALRLFLLRSSLLEEFDIPLCETVLAPLYSEPQDWAKLLETIVQKNLFALPVGTNGQWLRYHHLFRDYLQERFLREYPGEVKPILERLARFNETRGEWEKAYQLYKQLGDINALADLIERAGIPMYQHAMLTLDSWLKDLPPSIVQKRPGLLSLRGVIESAKGNLSEAIELFNRAVGKFREENNIPGLALALVRRGNVQRLLGNYDQAIQDAEEAARLAESNDDLQWNLADALRIKGLSLFRKGFTLQSSNFLQQALDIFTRINDVHSIPFLLMDTGMVNIAMGKYKETKLAYEKAIDMSRKIGNLSLQASLLNNLGFLYHQSGEYEQAIQSLEEGLLCAQRSGDKRMEALVGISIGDLYTEVEDIEMARQNYQHAGKLVEQLGERFLDNYLTLAEANLALLKAEISIAKEILDQVETSIKDGDTNYEQGLYHMLRGRLLLQNAKYKSAVKELLEAKQCFEKDEREMEGVLSRLWLAVAQYQIGEKIEAQEEIKALFQNPNQIKHYAVVALHQANEWLKEWRKDSSMKSALRGLFDKVDHLENELPRVRRQLRRLAHTVDIPSAQLVIHAFGQGHVKVNGRSLAMSDWQTQSVRELFFYFMTMERPATKEKIGSILWSDNEEPSKLKLRFKNEIYRLRRAVGQETILFEDDRYQFNSAMDHEYDVEAFEAYNAKAKSAETTMEKIGFYQRAVDLVKGHYLEDMGANWVWPERERLSQLFRSASLALAELYMKDAQEPKALNVCQNALNYDPTFEDVYQLMMNIYYRMKDRTSIIHIYEKCKEAMKKAFDLPPSDETQRLYNELLARSPK